VQNRTEQILVLAKAINLSWVATVILLLLQAGVDGSSRQQLNQSLASPDFNRRTPRRLSNSTE